MKDALLEWTGVVANVVPVVAFGWAVYLYVTQRSKFSAVYNVIVGLRNHESYRDLTKRLDRLDTLSISVKEQREAAICLLSEVLGQLKSNSDLNTSCANIVARLEEYLARKGKMSEPTKRRLCTEIREVLRTLTYHSISTIAGDAGNER